MIKKGFLIWLILGLIIGFVIGFSVNRLVNISNDSMNSKETSLNENDQKFVGKWEYGTQNMESLLKSKLDEYRTKYELKSGNWGCEYNNGHLISEIKYNKILVISKDGNVEYFDYYGTINSSCEVEIKTNYHYKGTFENSTIVFKQAESNSEWQDFRAVHHIYLVDDETLHYKVNDENISSATYLFMKTN